jgi:hypothetical protein
VNIADEIAAAVNQQLAVISESICQQGVKYSKKLLAATKDSFTGNDVSIFKPEPYFREFDMVGDCTYPNCPQDYGNLQKRSRFPDLPDFQNGSLTHSSVYLYSSYLGKSVRDNVTWSTLYANSNNLKRAIHGLSYEDKDMKVMYNIGPSTTIMFYVSASVRDDVVGGSSLFSVHRTFPGTVKNNSNYIPYNRPWFKYAPKDFGVYLYGPYRETFTQELTLTLSAKTTYSIGSSNTNIDVVNAAILRLSDMQQIITDVHYPNNGFGVLLAYPLGSSSAINPTVVVWKNGSVSPFDETSNSFRRIDYFDENLAKYDLSSKSNFRYSDPNGVEWIVASVPFFETAVGSDFGFTQYPGFIMLVFAQASLADEPSVTVTKNIDSTTNTVTIRTVIIACAIIGFDLVLIFFFANYLLEPLQKMTKLSQDVIRMQAEDEENRDYSGIIERAFLNLKRTDEVGALVVEYFNVICHLNNKNVIKRQTPKCPLNPFHYQTLNYSWEDFASNFIRVATGAVSAPPVPDVAQAALAIHDGSLDVLGQLSALRTPVKENQFSSLPIEDFDVEADARNGKVIPNVGDATALAVMSANAGTAIHAENVQIAEKIVGHRVGYLTSVRTLLYLFGAFVLAGYSAIMALTVVSLDDGGSTWTETAQVEITAQQIDALTAIASPKGVFVQVHMLTDIIAKLLLMLITCLSLICNKLDWKLSLEPISWMLCSVERSLISIEYLLQATTI